MNRSTYETQGPTLAEVIAEIKVEIKEFVQTRLDMLKAELRDKISAWKAGAMSGIVGLVFLATAYLLITLALVGLLAVAFWGSPYAWFLSFLIVGVVWALIGGIAVFLAIKEFRAHGLAPRKTIDVLKEDKIWLKNQARSEV